MAVRWQTRLVLTVLSVLNMAATHDYGLASAVRPLSHHRRLHATASHAHSHNAKASKPPQRLPLITHNRSSSRSVEIPEQYLPARNPEACRVLKYHRDYTWDRINETKVEQEPYEHLFIKDFYHPEVYACILAHLPKGRFDIGKTAPGEPSSEESSTTKERRRTIRLSTNKYLVERVKIDARKYAQVPASFKTFWNEFTKAFSSNRMRHVWMEKFFNTLRMRFTMYELKQDSMNKRFFFQFDLARDIPRYEIEPHTDTAEKVISIVHYLPQDRKTPSIGTAMLRSRGGLIDEGDHHTKWGEFGGGDWEKKFDNVKSAPYLPNSVFAFAPCQESWHTVMPVKGGKDLHRDTIQEHILLEKVIPGPTSEGDDLSRSFEQQLEEVDAENIEDDTTADKEDDEADVNKKVYSHLKGPCLSQEFYRTGDASGEGSGGADYVHENPWAVGVAAK
mmetsp:Transcript_39365/g.66101  ORF Transcript_39365/g.66101 Transcript_39365/m.66101 type:complete len:448 (-) Transcript_39365:44-1387(-)